MFSWRKRKTPLYWAWHAGASLERGGEEGEIRSLMAKGEIALPIVGAMMGGGAAASATGLGGVGLAFGGGAVGIGAAIAVAAPAMVAGSVGYGFYRGIRLWRHWNRDQTARELLRYFRETNQIQMFDRVFHIEGMGRLGAGRTPPVHASIKATLGLLADSESPAVMGLFCSPKGELIVTYDLSDKHWAYVRLIGERRFSGAGVAASGGSVQLHDIESVDGLTRTLEHAGFLKRLAE